MVVCNYGIGQPHFFRIDYPISWCVFVLRVGRGFNHPVAVSLRKTGRSFLTSGTPRGHPTQYLRICRWKSNHGHRPNWPAFEAAKAAGEARSKALDAAVAAANGKPYDKAAQCKAQDATMDALQKTFGAAKKPPAYTTLNPSLGLRGDVLEVVIPH